MRTGGCPERDANRASTGVATIVRGSSGLGSSRHRSSTRRRYPQCEQGDTQDKLHQPGFYRCGERRTKMRPTGLLPVWSRSCSRRFVPGRVRRPGLPVTATTLPANKTLIRIFTNDTNWASTSVARTSEREWEPNSHRILLRFRVGRDQHTTSDWRRQLEI